MSAAVRSPFFILRISFWSSVTFVTSLCGWAGVGWRYVLCFDDLVESDFFAFDYISVMGREIVSPGLRRLLIFFITRL